jgi:hypothetical protein
MFCPPQVMGVHWTPGHTGGLALAGATRIFAPAPFCLTKLPLVNLAGVNGFRSIPNGKAEQFVYRFLWNSTVIRFSCHSGDIRMDVEWQILRDNRLERGRESQLLVSRNRACSSRPVKKTRLQSPNPVHALAVPVDKGISPKRSLKRMSPTQPTWPGTPPLSQDSKDRSRGLSF